MKSLFTTALVTLFVIFLSQDSAHAVPAGDVEKRDPPLKYFKVHAPSENISPAAAALAASLEGQVPPLSPHLTKAPFQFQLRQIRIRRHLHRLQKPPRIKRLFYPYPVLL
jgi:hypothetical protein